jgi:hypothetical protein
MEGKKMGNFDDDEKRIRIAIFLKNPTIYGLIDSWLEFEVSTVGLTMLSPWLSAPVHNNYQKTHETLYFLSPDTGTQARVDQNEELINLIYEFLLAFTPIQTNFMIATDAIVHMVGKIEDVIEQDRIKSEAEAGKKRLEEEQKREAAAIKAAAKNVLAAELENYENLLIEKSLVIKNLNRQISDMERDVRDEVIHQIMNDGYIDIESERVDRYALSLEMPEEKKPLAE